MNLVNLWFGWMNVGFDGWFMFGMMFGDGLGQKSFDLVEFLWNYGGLKVFGYGGFRKKFERRKSCGD